MKKWRAISDCIKVKLREVKLRDKVARKIGPLMIEDWVREYRSRSVDCSVVTGDSLKVWVQ